MSRTDVQAMLDQSVVSFNRSVEVYQTPTPFGFTIRAHLRRYLAEATQEMIAEGNHREAVFWIVTLVLKSAREGNDKFYIMAPDGSDHRCDTRSIDQQHAKLVFWSDREGTLAILQRKTLARHHLHCRSANR